MDHETGLGIDIGGSGIKGAPVNLQTGELVADRLKIATPTPSTPAAVTECVLQIVEHFKDHTSSAADRSHHAGRREVRRGPHRGQHRPRAGSGRTAQTLIAESVGRPVHLVNDADAAGVAEARYGAARATKGLVFMATLGTGIGTALLYDGVLIPNAELGHLEIDGHDAEKRAASSVKDKEHLSYEEWAEQRLQLYFSRVEDLLWPDLIVVGGGVSRRRRSSCRCCTCARRSSRPSCRTAPGSSERPGWPTSARSEPRLRAPAAARSRRSATQAVQPVWCSAPRPGAGVPVEVLVEPQLVAPARVLVQPGPAGVDRPVTARRRAGTARPRRGQSRPPARDSGRRPGRRATRPRRRGSARAGAGRRRAAGWPASRPGPRQFELPP